MLDRGAARKDWILCFNKRAGGCMLEQGQLMMSYLRLSILDGYWFQYTNRVSYINR